MGDLGQHSSIKSGLDWPKGQPAAAVLFCIFRDVGFYIDVEAVQSWRNQSSFVLLWRLSGKKARLIERQHPKDGRIIFDGKMMDDVASIADNVQREFVRALLFAPTAHPKPRSDRPKHIAQALFLNFPGDLRASDTASLWI